MTTTDIATVASAIFAGASALAAASAIYVPWKNQYNQELLHQAILSLERAYAALSNGGKNVKPALADRLNWLTSARHIESFKSLKARIKTELHRTLCAEHEEFWRHQFYICLDIPNIHSSAYYDETPPPNQRLGIEPHSAIIIYSFASWPNEKIDPIDAVDVQKLIRECKPLQGNIGLRLYIKKFEEFSRDT